MIVHLNGDYETVDYVPNRSVLLYDNIEDEEYPLHWHNAIEIIMPLTNGFEAVCAGKNYKLSERDILIIPGGTLHNLKAQSGRRIIFLCDNNSLAANPALSELYSVLSEPVLINSDYDKEFLKSLNHILEEIYVLYSNYTDITEVYIYIKLVTLLARIKEYQLNEIKYDDGGKYVDKFNLILKYIEQNYANDITLEKLADIAGYSPYHFQGYSKIQQHDLYQLPEPTPNKGSRASSP